METVKYLLENTYVDNIMTTGHIQERLDKFKIEATYILERGRFSVHKWESDIKELESDGMQSPSMISGHKWDKENDSIEIQILKQTEDEIIIKRSMLSLVGSIYDALGLMSLTLAEGKAIYR